MHHWESVVHGWIHESSTYAASIECHTLFLWRALQINRRLHICYDPNVSMTYLAARANDCINLLIKLSFVGGFYLIEHKAAQTEKSIFLGKCSCQVFQWAHDWTPPYMIAGELPCKKGIGRKGCYKLPHNIKGSPATTTSTYKFSLLHSVLFFYLHSYNQFYYIKKVSWQSNLFFHYVKVS